MTCECWQAEIDLQGWIYKCSQVKICKRSRTLGKFSLTSTVVVKGTTRKSMFKKLAPGWPHRVRHSALRCTSKFYCCGHTKRVTMRPVLGNAKRIQTQTHLAMCDRALLPVLASGNAFLNFHLPPPVCCKLPNCYGLVTPQHSHGILSWTT